MVSAKKIAERGRVYDVVEEMWGKGVFGKEEVSAVHPEKSADFEKQLDDLNMQVAAAAEICRRQVLNYLITERWETLESQLRKTREEGEERIRIKVLESEGSPAVLDAAKEDLTELNMRYAESCASLAESKEAVESVVGTWSPAARLEFFESYAEAAVFIISRGAGTNVRAYIYAHVISALNEKSKKEYPEAVLFVDLLIRHLLYAEEDIKVRKMAWLDAHMQDTPFLTEKEVLVSSRRGKNDEGEISAG